MAGASEVGQAAAEPQQARGGDSLAIGRHQHVLPPHAPAHGLWRTHCRANHPGADTASARLPAILVGGGRTQLACLLPSTLDGASLLLHYWVWAWISHHTVCDRSQRAHARQSFQRRDNFATLTMVAVVPSSEQPQCRPIPWLALGRLSARVLSVGITLYYNGHDVSDESSARCLHR